MGQYYLPILAKKSESEIKCADDIYGYLYTHDYDNGLKLMEHSWVGNDFVKAVITTLEDLGGAHLIWCGDYCDEKKFEGYDENDVQNLYDLAHMANKFNTKPSETPRYILNRTKRQYLDMENHKFNPDEWTVHPLPLLTANSNGRGGGDYEGTDMELVGTWAGDFISVSDTKPDDYELLKPNFKEAW